MHPARGGTDLNNDAESASDTAPHPPDQLLVAIPLLSCSPQRYRPPQLPPEGGIRADAQKPQRGTAKLMARCSDGVQDQGSCSPFNWNRRQVFPCGSSAGEEAKHLSLGQFKESLHLSRVDACLRAHVPERGQSQDSTPRNTPVSTNRKGRSGASMRSRNVTSWSPFGVSNLVGEVLAVVFQRLLGSEQLPHARLSLHAACPPHQR